MLNDTPRCHPQNIYAYICIYLWMWRSPPYLNAPPRVCLPTTHARRTATIVLGCCCVAIIGLWILLPLLLLLLFRLTRIPRPPWAPRWRHPSRSWSRRQCGEAHGPSACCPGACGAPRQGPALLFRYAQKNVNTHIPVLRIYTTTYIQTNKHDIIRYTPSTCDTAAVLPSANVNHVPAFPKNTHMHLFCFQYIDQSDHTPPYCCM